MAQSVKNLPAMQETWVRKIPWRGEPTPVFLPGELHGQRRLAGYSPQGHRESDTPEQLTLDQEGGFTVSLRETSPCLLSGHTSKSHFPC